MKSGRQRVGEQDEVMLPRIAGLAGQPRAIRISKRDTQELQFVRRCNRPSQVSVRGACFTWIGREALRPIAVYAVGAETASKYASGR